MQGHRGHRKFLNPTTCLDVLFATPAHKIESIRPPEPVKESDQFLVSAEESALDSRSNKDTVQASQD